MAYLICLLSGILTALPMMFDKLWPLAWVSMAPMCWVLITQKPKYRHTLVWSLGYYGVLYNWFSRLYPLKFLGMSEKEAALTVALCWIGLALLQSVGTAFIAPLFRLTKGSRRVFYPITFAAVWTLLEWAQTQTWMGVPFMRIAISQCPSLPMIQNASLFGSLFIGFLIALTNGFAAMAFIRFRENIHKKPALHINVWFAVAVSIAAINFATGYLAQLYYSDEGLPVRVALIQGNLSADDKWGTDLTVYDTCDLYCELSREAVEAYRPQIIVWPESVINVTIKYNKYLCNQISQLAMDSGAIIMVGTFDDGVNEKGEDESYCAMIPFLPDGSTGTPYYKRHLVPFGEYLPMPWLFSKIPLLDSLNASDSQTPGSDTAILETKYGKIGSLVCFDSIYETLTLDTVRDGAELIALITNDSWYKDSTAVYQHYDHAVLRAVESGRYIIRAASTGISGIIKPNGETVDSLAPLTRGYVTGEAYVNSGETLYSRVGNLIVWLSFALFLGGVMQKFILHDAEKGAKPSKAAPKKKTVKSKR